MAVLLCLEGEPQGWGRPRGVRGSQSNPELLLESGPLINSSWQQFLAGHVCLPAKSQKRLPGAAHWPWHTGEEWWFISPLTASLTGLLAHPLAETVEGWQGCCGAIRFLKRERRKEGRERQDKEKKGTKRQKKEMKNKKERGYRLE